MRKTRTAKNKRAAKPKKRPMPALPKTPVSEISPEQQIIGAVLLGKIKGYLPKIRVMTLTLEAPLAVGETIRVKGHTTDLTQRVEHMQVNRQGVQSATAGEAVGLEVADLVRVGDAVYKL